MDGRAGVMKNKSAIQTVNWIVPLFILGLIIFGQTVEALILAVSYTVYRIIIDLSKIYSYIAVKQYVKGNLPKARKYYKKASEARVKEPPVMASYAYLLILLGEYEQAAAVLDKLEEMKFEGKTVTSVKLCRAILFWKVDRNLSLAISSLENLDVVLKNQWFYNILAKLYIFSGDLEHAKKIAAEGYEYLNSNINAIENLLVIHCINEDWVKAKSAADKLMKGKKKMLPSSLDAYYYAGLAYEKSGQDEDARPMYKKALEYEHTTMTYISNGSVLEKGRI